MDDMNRVEHFLDKALLELVSAAGGCDCVARAARAAITNHLASLPTDGPDRAFSDRVADDIEDRIVYAGDLGYGFPRLHPERWRASVQSALCKAWRYTDPRAARPLSTQPEVSE